MGGSAGRQGWAGLLLSAVLLLPACDSPPSGAPGGTSRAPGALSLVSNGGLVRTVRPGGEVVLTFSRPLDGIAARGAVRVEDETRGRAPIPVEAEARGEDLVLRARGGAGWRPGAVLAVRVAGLPSLSSLRAADGAALPGEVVEKVRVRSPRRTDRVPPTLLSSEPADGATGVDPAAAVLLRFSEPMSVRSFEDGGGVPGKGTVAVLADGNGVTFRCWLDRTRTELTLLPDFPLPSAAAVEVALTDRVRDSGGNPLAAASVHRISFTTVAAAPPDGAGRIVETFEDRARLDPLGTTVRWNDPAAPGVLAGTIEAGALEMGGGGDAALLLDPRGGTLRILVTPAELGDEGRILKGLQLLVPPGAAPGELLEPAVRVATAGGLALEGSETEGLTWTVATEGLGGATPRASDGTLSLPFRHPVTYTGAGSIVVEISWRGTAGAILLRAARQKEPRCLLAGVDPEPVALRVTPVLRLESVGRRAAARSAWMDAGAPASWLEPRVRPLPDPSRVTIRFQGAPGLADGTGPDLARATGWTDDRAVLDGVRWIRFRADFAEAGPLAAPAVIDEITLPFVAR